MTDLSYDFINKKIIAKHSPVKEITKKLKFSPLSNNAKCAKALGKPR